MVERLQQTADRITKLLTQRGPEIGDIGTALAAAGSNAFSGPRTTYGEELNRLRARRIQEQMTLADALRSMKSLDLQERQQGLSERKFGFEMQQYEDALAARDPNAEAINGAMERFVPQEYRAQVLTALAELPENVDASNANNAVARVWTEMQKALPRERKFERIGDTLLEVTDGGVRPVFSAPQRPPQVTPGEYERLMDARRRAAAAGDEETVRQIDARMAKLTDTFGGININMGETQQSDTGQGLPNVPFSQATGASGFLGGIANTITDALGLPLAAPEAEAAAIALSQLQTITMLKLSADIEGRPTNQVREEIRKLTVEPRSLGTGDERALEKLTQLRNLALQEMLRAQEVANSPAYNATARGKAALNAREIRDIVATYDTIIGQWGGGGRPAASPEDEALIKKYLEAP